MSDVFLFHYTIINKNILLTYSVFVHLLLTRSALILADAVIFQNPFSRLIKKKKNPLPVYHNTERIKREMTE